MTADPHRRHSKWGSEARVYALLYGVPLLILFPWTKWRPDAQVYLSVRTRAIEFTVGQHYKGAGLFAGGPYDLTFESMLRMHLPTSLIWRRTDVGRDSGTTRSIEGGSVRFRNVQLQSLDLPSESRVRLEWFRASPSGVRLSVRYPGSPQASTAAVFLDGGSTVEFRGSRTAGVPSPFNGALSVPPGAMGATRIHPGDEGILATVTPRSLGTASPTLPSVEGGIPILAGSGISFLNNDTSAIIGIDNTMQIVNADRKESVLEGQLLRLRAMREGASITSLEIKDGIAVRLQGAMGELRLNDTDLRPSPAEYLRAQKVVSAWLTTAVLIGTGGLTIATRANLISIKRSE